MTEMNFSSRLRRRFTELSYVNLTTPTRGRPGRHSMFRVARSVCTACKMFSFLSIYLYILYLKQSTCNQVVADTISIIIFVALCISTGVSHLVV